VEYSTKIICDIVLAMPSPTPPPASPPAEEHVEPGEHEQEVTEEDLNADNDDAPLRVHAIDDLIEDAELASFNEAEKEAAWQAAMREEMKAIEDNDTWEITSLPTDHRAIGLKWVYKVKSNEAGDIMRHKVCLVAKGYVQCADIDFDEVFAPVACLESVHMMVALEAHEGWEVHQMDVKSVFLNDAIKEEVYVQQPHGFIIPGSESNVLRKALYGLQQAPRAWNAKLDATMGSLHF
jgi:hypothetical protein